MLSITLLLRVFLVMYALLRFGPAWFFSRGSEMGFLAFSLLHGEGLSSPFGVPTGPTAIVAPGYPLLVSSVFFVLGSYTWAAALFLMLFHAGCNTVTVYLAYRLGRTFSDAHSAGVASMFWACSLPLLWMPTIFWETSISCMLTLTMMWIVLRLWEKRSLAISIACGALCGLAGLINPALVPAFLTLTMSTLLRASPKASRLQHCVVALASLVLVFSPWPIRNARVLHKCVLTRTTVGLELWLGNHPGSSGFLEPALFPTNNPTELATYRRLGEIHYTAYKGSLARAYIASHPAHFILLSGRRLLRFWTGTGTDGGSVLFGLHASISTFLGFWGLVLLWQHGRRSTCFCAGIFLLLFPLPYYITHAEFRYRLVLDPLLTVLSAPALQWMFAKLRSEPRSTSAWAVQPHIPVVMTPP